MLSKIENYILSKPKLAFIANRFDIKGFIKFGIVGFSGTSLDFIILNVLVIFLSLNVYLAASISFVIAVTNNFLLNKFWTFNAVKQKDSGKKQFIKYFIVSIIALAMNLGLMYLFIEFFSLWYNWAKLLATAIILFWNFFANKYWTFKSEPVNSGDLNTPVK